MDASPSNDAILVIHGGAGTIRRETITPAQDTEARRGLFEALNFGGAVFQRCGSAVDAVCAAICCLENSPFFNAGRGSVLTYDGHVEMDAALMDGAVGNAGAVAGVRTVRNPILLARAVMEHSPFVLLASEGAEEFARTQTLAHEELTYFLTPAREKQWHDWKREHRESEMRLSEDGGDSGAAPANKFGTVGAVARDTRGTVAAATSTGGMTGKRYGRIGDSPMIGAGTWAANATCAVSATGHGEYFIRQAVAHDIHARMAYGGVSLADAAHAVIHQLAQTGGAGGVIAIDAQGNAALPFNTPGMFRGILHADGTSAVAIYDDEA